MFTMHVLLILSVCHQNKMHVELERKLEAEHIGHVVEMSVSGCKPRLHQYVYVLEQDTYSALLPLTQL